MKFQVKRISYRSTPDYPYTHRLEFWGPKEELLPVGRWVKARALKCTWAGFSLYIADRELTMFLLAWGDYEHG